MTISCVSQFDEKNLVPYIRRPPFGLPLFNRHTKEKSAKKRGKDLGLRTQAKNSLNFCIERKAYDVDFGNGRLGNPCSCFMCEKRREGGIRYGFSCFFNNRLFEVT